MNPNEKELLQKTYEMVEENNKILHGIKRSNRLSSFFRAIYWVIIAAAALGTYWFVQPYINVALTAYKSIQNDIKTVKTTTTNLTNPINNLINKIK